MKKNVHRKLDICQINMIFFYTYGQFLLCRAFWATDKFMTYIGLDQAPVEPSSADTCGINRSHVSFI